MKETLPAADLFVVLDRAFRRRARECNACVFTLPFRVRASNGDANWTIVPGAGCSERCHLILEDLLASHQAEYRLAETHRGRRLRSRPH